MFTWSKDDNSVPPIAQVERLLVKALSKSDVEEQRQRSSSDVIHFHYLNAKYGKKKNRISPGTFRVTKLKSDNPPCQNYIIQHTTPMAKFRVPLTPILYWQVMQFSQENTSPSIPPRHHWNTAKTPPNITEHRQDATDTPPKCHQDTNDHRNTFERF